MLYVFLVNSGATFGFDMQLAMGTVDALKLKVAERCDIPVERQVLLVSGGEWLEGTARVGSYSAGTDTSPIFLFSKQSGDVTDSTTASTAPATSMLTTVDLTDEDSAEQQVAGALALPSSYSTVVSRSQLAQQLYERGKQQVQLCDQLIRDQHLQQQGWSAVVANMDDLSQSLQAGSVRFQHMYEQYLEERPRQLQLLDDFQTDVQLLARVPLLDSLDAAVGGGDAPPGRVPRGSSLLDWISAQDTRRLEEVCDKAQQGLDVLDDDFRHQLRAELRQLLDPAMCADMAEIRGLEDRLMRLDELRHRAKQVLVEQMELARAFIQNQSRASCVNDPSVLPDLCQSHCTQLQVMLAKHKMLLDTRRRCAKAKEELSSNIGTRLGWVVTVQRRMTDLCSRLMIYSERLKLLRQQVAVLGALHAAPRVYCRAAAEVVRRRAFSSRFLTWARAVSADASAAVAEEKRCRKRFVGLLGVHFLTSVFPGLEAVPVEFACECPADFDSRLPELGEVDLQRLRDAVPEMADLLQAPDLSQLQLPVLTRQGSDASCSRCAEQLADVRSAFARMRSEVAELLESLSSRMEEDCVAATAAVRCAAAAETTRRGELEIAASEAGTYAALAEARAEEQAALLAQAERRCSELNAEMEQERAASAALRSQLQADRRPSTASPVVGDERLEKLRSDHEAALRTSRDEYEAKLLQHARSMQELRETGDRQRQQLEQLRAQLLDEQQRAVATVGDRLRAEHREEMLTLRARFRMMMSANNLGGGSGAASPEDPHKASGGGGGGDALLAEAEEALRDASQLRRDNDRLRDQLTRSAASLLERGQVSVLSCADGDVVLVVWDHERRHYRIYQEASLLYFVHADSYAVLGLSAQTTAASPPYVTAQVVSHEFCQAKKDGNRYKVPRGTRFYRVKLQPWSRPGTSDSTTNRKISICSGGSTE